MARPLGTTKIQSPEHLWDLFQDNKRSVKQNPILKHTFVGKEGRSEYSELERPLTIDKIIHNEFEQLLKTNRVGELNVVNYNGQQLDLLGYFNQRFDELINELDEKM